MTVTVQYYQNITFSNLVDNHPPEHKSLNYFHSLKKHVMPESNIKKNVKGNLKYIGNNATNKYLI